jgi:hypothetical protein
MDTSERGDDMMFVFQAPSNTAADKGDLIPVVNQVVKSFALEEDVPQSAIKPATAVSFDLSHTGKTEKLYKELPE